MCVLMAAVCGAAERPAEIVETNGVPTIQINKAAQDFKVGKMVPGDAYTTFFAKTNAAGEVTEISSVPATRTVGDIFSSRVGMRYVPGEGEVRQAATGETPVAPVWEPDGRDAHRPSSPDGRDAHRPSEGAPDGQDAHRPSSPDGRDAHRPSSPDGRDAHRPSGEILREIPEAEVSPRLRGWERPRFVVLEAKTMEVRGVFSISDELADAKAAREFFEKTLLKELVGFFGEKHPLYPLGGNEFALRHNDEHGNELEMRIKGFATDGQHIRYIIYHGRPYVPVDAAGAMNGRFASVLRQSGIKF